MQCKRRVLAKFPKAHLFAATLWDDGSPMHLTVMPGDGTVRYLDIHDISDPQSAGAAWRAAHYWCVRNPRARPVTETEIADIIAGRLDVVGLLRSQVWPTASRLARCPLIRPW